MDALSRSLFLDNDWQGWNGGNLAPSRDLYGNLYQDKLGMPFEKFPDGDIRKKALELFQMMEIMRAFS